jgi:hypothetical protein
MVDMNLRHDYPKCESAFASAFGQDTVGTDYVSWQEAWSSTLLRWWLPTMLVELRSELIRLYSEYEDPREFMEAINELGVYIWLEDEPGGILAWRDRVLRMLEDYMRERGIILD